MPRARLSPEPTRRAHVFTDAGAALHIGGVATDRSPTGAKLVGGDQITPNLAVQGGHVDFGRLGVLNGKTRRSLIGSDRGTSARLGAGLTHAIDRNLPVPGEWERLRFDTTGMRANTDLYSLGVKYSF